MKKAIVLLIITFISFGAFAQNKQRLDDNFGFREFKLQTDKSVYAGYEMKKVNMYELPDIIDVYEIPYDLVIGNTSIDKMHLFFLGDRLVRVTAVLKDSLHLSYLKKSFGEGEAPTVTVKLDKKLKQDIADGIVKFAYEPIWSWKAETVRFEEKWLYLCDNGSCVKKMTLDLYLVDFQDLMRTMLS